MQDSLNDLLDALPTEPRPAFLEAAVDEVPMTVNTSVTVDVLANDALPVDVLEVSLKRAPADGSAVLTSDGLLTYVPDPAFSGVDSLAYTVTDSAGNVDSALVAFSVAPLAVDDAATTSLGAPVLLRVLENDVSLFRSLEVVEQPTSGTVEVVRLSTAAFRPPLVAPLALRYTPDPGFVGSDTLVYEFGGEDGTSDTALVSMTVTPTPSPSTPDVPAASSGGSGFLDTADSSTPFDFTPPPLSTGEIAFGGDRSRLWVTLGALTALLGAGFGFLGRRIRLVA